MIKKLIILVLLLVPIVGIAFYSCCGCDIETRYGTYTNKSMYLKNLDNSSAEITESDSLQLNKDAYGIRIYLEREKVAIACAKQINSIFIQSAYATYCECPPEFIYSPSDSIVSIKIFTVNNFDSQHLENSDITDYFRVAGSFSAIENYVANMNYTYEYDFEYWGREVKLDLLLMTAPTANNKQQFKVQVALSDGRVWEQQTPEIELL